jgi:hypothetical protein
MMDVEAHHERSIRDTVLRFWPLDQGGTWMGSQTLIPREYDVFATKEIYETANR